MKFLVFVIVLVSNLSWASEVIEIGACQARIKEEVFINPQNGERVLIRSGVWCLAPAPIPTECSTQQECQQLQQMQQHKCYQYQQQQPYHREMNYRDIDEVKILYSGEVARYQNQLYSCN